MKMIVGLGNPGREYENTRHNVGFMILDEYAKKNDISTFKRKFNGLYTTFIHNNETYVLLKPQSYMNLSGTVIKKFASFYKIKPEDILVIHDDLDLPIGKIKIKYKGSSGGHNGIKNIIENLKTEEFPRFKVGIGKDENISYIDYVIGKLSKKELEFITKIFDFSSYIIDDFLDYNIEKVMSKYNGEEYEVKLRFITYIRVF